MSKVENIYHEAFDAYLDLECKNKLLANLNVNSNKITNLLNPEDNQDATTKKYVDNEDITFLKFDGSRPMAETLDLDNSRITNLGTPAVDYDATTKKYVDDEDFTFLKLDGSRPMLDDLDLVNNKISSVGEPEVNTDATTKSYVDDKDITFLKLDGSRPMQSDLNLNNNKIISLGEPVAASDATTKSYVNVSISTFDDTLFLKLDGSNSMTGILDLGNNKISNVTNPTDNQDVATKSYVDGKESLFLKIDGTSEMQSDLNLNSNKITSVGTPTNNQDATIKSYVDEVNPHAVDFPKTEYKLYACKLTNLSDIPDNPDWEYNGEISIIDETENDVRTKSLQLNKNIDNTIFLKCPFADTIDTGSCYTIYSRLKIDPSASACFKIETSANKVFKLELINLNNVLKIMYNDLYWNAIESPIIDPGEYFDFEYTKFARGENANYFVVRINGDKVLPVYHIRTFESDGSGYNGVTIYNKATDQNNYCYFRFIRIVTNTTRYDTDTYQYTNLHMIVDKLSKTNTILHTPAGIYDYTFKLSDSVSAPQYSKIIIKPLNVGGKVILRNNDHNKILYNYNLEIKIPITIKKDIVLTNISSDPENLHYVLDTE